jgi:hypothetical protein
MAKKIRSKIWEDVVPYSEAYKELSELLKESDTPLQYGSFEEFVLDQGPKTFPQYNFNVWHIRLLCNKIDRLLASENKYLLAVLPRYHLKSTILNNFFSIYRMLNSHGEGLCVSYKEELASIHLYHTKEMIRNNKELSSIMTDLSPQSDNTINYKMGNKRCKIYPSGIFAVKRGLHTDLITVCDDLQGDLSNPMTFTDIDKSIRIFDAEILNIPNKECPLVVFGTVISSNDLLFHLKDKEAFRDHMIWLPALHPDSEHAVLWDEYDQKWLEARKEAGGWKAFSTEFLLIPVMSTEAFFTREQLDKVIDSNLANYQVPGAG